MSWLFGVKPKIPVSPPAPPTPPSNPDGSSSGTTTTTTANATNSESQYRFDSAALERAANAAKDLERSQNAKEILNLTREQERTKQLEYEKQIAEFHVYQEELKGKQQQMNAEEKRKLLDEETRHAAEVNNLKYKKINLLKLSRSTREHAIKIN
jgi:ATPase family AAA domain-containing protein 3A/B